MYNKLFSQILDSSIWLEQTPTRIVWITFLAAMDEDGFARFAAIENLASRARVTRKQAEEAVQTLAEPDPASSNPDNEGRRIERVPGGWVILNAGHYRAIHKRDVEREQNRLRVARFRQRQKDKTGAVTESNESNGYKGLPPEYENENAYALSLRGESREGKPPKSPRPPKPPGIGWTPTDGYSNISDKDLDGWRDAYPACNISLQLKRMHEWLLANPEKAHKSNWRRFIVNWLKAEQDRGGDQRQDKRKQGARILSPHETPEFDAQYERDQEALRQAKAEGKL